MFTRILVPLDGSVLAEHAIPVAACIARATGGIVVLVRVTDIPMQYGPYLYSPYLSQSPIFAQEILDAEQAKAEYYLREVARLECLEDVRVEVKAACGTAAATILEMAQLMHVDLIVMYSHERTGLKRWALGSVAQKVVRHCPLPVLLLREGSPQTLGIQAEMPGPLRALVALDGSPYSEVALKEDVADTLIRMAELGEGMSMAEVQGCSLIAMATHGWGGLQHRMVGSVTGRVLDGTKLPLLIVHPQQQHAASMNEATGQAAATAGSRNL